MRNKWDGIRRECSSFSSRVSLRLPFRFVFLFPFTVEPLVVSLPIRVLPAFHCGVA